jgi:hypothetical protein
MTCERCKTRIKDWQGDDPKCAFKEGQIFSSDNWRCGTMDALRKLINDGHLVYSNDDTLAVIPIGHLPYEFPAFHLVLGWYKSRGRVETALFVGEGKASNMFLFDAEKILSLIGENHGSSTGD